MKKLVQACVVLLGMVVIEAYAALPVWSEKELALGDFTSVDSQYINDLEIIGGGDKARVILSGDARMFAYVKSSVSNNVLHLRAPHGVHVLIKTPHLQQISVVGEGQVYGKALDGVGPLSVSAAGAVEVYLRGPVNLTNVTTTGSSVVRGWWLDAQDLHVMSSGQSRLFLTGRVFRESLDLFGSSVVDASRLRSKQIVVQTSHRSIAKVLPLDGLTAYANNASRIEYFKEPRRLTSFSGQQGNVLHVADFE